MPESSSSYSPDKFYTASRNKKGFATTARVNIPPEAMSEIAAMVASRQIGEYRTTADFYRDAIVHRLKYLQEKLTDGEQFRMSRLASMMIDSDDLERFSMERETRARILRQVKDSYNNAEDEMERRRIRARIEKMHDSTPDRILKEELGKFLR